MEHDKLQPEKIVLDIQATKEQEAMLKQVKKWDYNELLTAICIIVYIVLNIIDFIKTQNLDYIGMMIFTIVFALEYITSKIKIKKQHGIINLLCENLLQEREANKNDSEKNKK